MTDGRCRWALVPSGTVQLMNPLAVQETNMTLDEICDAIGYKDVPRFIKNFKEKYEMTPGKFRKQGVAANHQP